MVNADAAQRSRKEIANQQHVVELLLVARFDDEPSHVGDATGHRRAIATGAAYDPTPNAILADLARREIVQVPLGASTATRCCGSPL